MLQNGDGSYKYLENYFLTVELIPTIKLLQSVFSLEKINQFWSPIIVHNNWSELMANLLISINKLSSKNQVQVFAPYIYDGKYAVKWFRT